MGEVPILPLGDKVAAQFARYSFAVAYHETINALTAEHFRVPLSHTTPGGLPGLFSAETIHTNKRRLREEMAHPYLSGIPTKLSFFQSRIYAMRRAWKTRRAQERMLNRSSVEQESPKSWLREKFTSQSYLPCATTRFRFGTNVD